MAFCDNCGAPIADNAKFCENCGSPRMQAAAGNQYSYGNQQQDQQYSYGNQQSDSQYSYGNQQSDSQYSYGNQQQEQQSAYSSQQAQYSSPSYSSPAYDSGASAYGQSNAYTAGPTPSMGFVEAVQTCFSKYATFEGRARRSEFWYFTLFNFCVQLVLGIVSTIIFGAPEDGGANVLGSIYSLAVLLPSLAVFWRRMHDLGKSGLWFLLNLLPCVGSIVLIVFECMDSQPGENQYGVSPKYPAG